MKLNFLTIGLSIIVCLFIGSCEKSSDSIESDNSVDFSEALLKTFPLSEVDIELIADRISIQQPELINGVPQGEGEIELELENTDIEKFSLKQVDFDTADFSISPAIGAQSIIPGEKITYTITSTKDINVSLRYNVLVTVKDIPPHSQVLKITNLSFLKANNPGLSQDITSFEVREHSNQLYSGTIMVIVPNGTDFSNLIPTLDYEGSTIKYTTEHYGNHADFNDFTEGTSVNFGYPKIVAFQIYNSDKSRYREYRVLVDVKDPITFDKESISLSSLPLGLSSYDSVVGFTYNGNYPIKSDLRNSTIGLTTTPNDNTAEYYLFITLNEDNPSDDDKIINNGERGSLDLKINLGADRHDPAIKYTFDVAFNAMLNSYGTPGINDHGGLEDLNFMIYDPIKIEIVTRF
jgi:hypothetical protein